MPRLRSLRQGWLPQVHSRRAAATLFLGWCVAALASAQNPAVTVSIDAGAGRRAINPLIYGVAYGSAAEVADLNAPLNRYGGNNASRYNWQLNADNRDFDWYFESIADDSAVPGERGDTFIAASKAGGAQPMITVPMLDWIAKLGPNRGKLASFSQAKYGAQTGSDAQWFPDAGNGVKKSNGQYVTGNDPNDANVPNSTTVQQGWVNHLVTQWGGAAGAGLRYYLLDNEHSIWHATHRDVHPAGATMEEIRQRMIAYGTMIKNADPSALVVGPEEWGWSGYLLSGYDQQYGAAHNWCCFPDRAAHGNADYLPWLLDQLHQDEVATGRRVLDVFSVHFYPQSGEFGDDVSGAMQSLRNRSTRALWDPAYTDVSWIGDQVVLIPRLRGWVAAYYPGLQTAITEYNWGAEGHINGATTQADLYGIFGREGLDIAARWTTPDPATPTYKAMKMYRNYDGNRSGFGETSVAAAVPDPDTLSAFAALRAGDGALTVMVISKVLSGATPVTLALGNFVPAGPVQVWQLTAANAITRLADASAGAAGFTATVPAQSVTLFVLAPAAASGMVSVTRAGSGSGAVVSDPPGISCGAGCSAAWPGATVVTLTATPDAGSVFAGWLGACTGTGVCTVHAGAASNVSATFAPEGVAADLDVDANGDYDALTDGLLLIRHLFGLNGTALTSGALGTGATRQAPTAIAQHLNDILPRLDIDGNGQADALTDGLLLIRYLFGLRGPALIAGAVDPAGLRTTAPLIEAQIESLLP